MNRVKLGGITELLGDPAVRIEKPHTIIRFPGGSIEVARTTDDRYWVHVAVQGRHDERSGRIVKARLDAAPRYADEANETLNREIATGDVAHVAFLIAPGALAEDAA